MRGFLFYLLRPEPEPVGVSVEPLGEALGPRVFPDGLWVLFGEVTVVPALPVVVPFIDEPVALPVAAEPPAAGLPPAVAPPACASAKVPESANAVANAIVLIFMLVFLGFCPRLSRHEYLMFRSSTVRWKLPGRVLTRRQSSPIACHFDLCIPYLWPARHGFRAQ